MQYIIVFILLLLSSCSHRNRLEADKELFPVDSMNVEVGSPTLIKATDSQLFVNHSFSDGYDIDVIDIQGDSIMYSFAQRGQGANEFLQIVSLDVFKKENNWYVGLFDNLQRKLMIYSVDSLNRYKGNCSPVCVKTVDAESRFLEVYSVNDGYVATGRTEKKYTLLDKDMEMHSLTGDYLVCGNRKDDYMLQSKANYGRLYFSDNRQCFASVVFMSGTLSVNEIDLNGVNPQWSYTTSGFEYELNGNRLKQLSPTGYLAAGFIENTSVLGLYSGEEKEGGTNYGNEFHVFTSQGVLSEKYHLSSCLYNFCVSPDGRSVYAISYQSDPKILIYRL